MSRLPPMNLWVLVLLALPPAVVLGAGWHQSRGRLRQAKSAVVKEAVLNRHNINIDLEFGKSNQIVEFVKSFLCAGLRQFRQ